MSAANWYRVCFYPGGGKVWQVTLQAGSFADAELFARAKVLGSGVMNLMELNAIRVVSTCYGSEEPPRPDPADLVGAGT